MAAGKARKSTHKKRSQVAKTLRSSPTKGANKENRVVNIDSKKQYEIETVGPVHLSWGKKRKKNAKGKIVKEWYIKKNSKHRIWVKWAQPFEDEHEKDDEYWTKWSAEEQGQLESGALKSAVKEALNKKVVWPWVSTEDDACEERRKILKLGGYKEWVPSGKEKKDAKKWKVKFGITPETDRSSEKSDSDTDSTSNTDNDVEEEEDEV